MFDFLNKPKDNSSDFNNGEYAVQRDEEYIHKIKEGAVKFIKKHHKWIVKNWSKEGGEFSSFNGLTSYYVIRCLYDNDSPLYNVLMHLYYTCPKCFKEYGQAYYARHCSCNSITKIWKGPMIKELKKTKFKGDYMEKKYVGKKTVILAKGLLCNLEVGDVGTIVGKRKGKYDTQVEFKKRLWLSKSEMKWYTSKKKKVK